MQTANLKLISFPGSSLYLFWERGGSETVIENDVF